MTQAAPKSMRMHIGLFGRRNVGKSSLLNALTRQSVAIVSEIAGTTTDPVEKPMEMLPLGPVLFIDTAGIDDVGDLGEQRVEKTKRVFDRTDVGILVTESGMWGEFEKVIVSEFKLRKTPLIVVFNKVDVVSLDDQDSQIECLGDMPWVKTVASTGQGVNDLREALIKVTPEEFINTPSILADLVPAGELAILVVPIDAEAPKGRLILPQVQTIRDLLDNDAYCMVVKERELRDALNRLNKPPALVVTDSQAFLKVAADTPDEIPMTSFSILFARFKGDLTAYTHGATAIDSLRPGDRILIAEACTHHPIAEDIGRVKIPRWLTQYVGGALEFSHYSGHDFPDDLEDYKLVIQCGACVHNRRAVLSRIERCRRAGVAITNYGLAIAYSLGIFARALRPFPAATEIFQQKN